MDNLYLSSKNRKDVTAAGAPITQSRKNTKVCPYSCSTSVSTRGEREGSLSSVLHWGARDGTVRCVCRLCVQQNGRGTERQPQPISLSLSGPWFRCASSFALLPCESSRIPGMLCVRPWCFGIGTAASPGMACEVVTGHRSSSVVLFGWIRISAFLARRFYHAGCMAAARQGDCGTTAVVHQQQVVAARASKVKSRNLVL